LSIDFGKRTAENDYCRVRFTNTMASYTEFVLELAVCVAFLREALRLLPRQFPRPPPPRERRRLGIAGVVFIVGGRRRLPKVVSVGLA